LVHFSGFGIMHQEKSGNPVLGQDIFSNEWAEGSQKFIDAKK
jgi:hypothetical protein